jgi:hypothetical protein
MTKEELLSFCSEVGISNNGVYGPNIILFIKITSDYTSIFRINLINVTYSELESFTLCKLRIVLCLRVKRKMDWYVASGNAFRQLSFVYEKL